MLFVHLSFFWLFNQPQLLAAWAHSLSRGLISVTVTPRSSQHVRWVDEPLFCEKISLLIMVRCPATEEKNKNHLLCTSSNSSARLLPKNNRTIFGTAGWGTEESVQLGLCRQWKHAHTHKHAVELRSWAIKASHLSVMFCTSVTERYQGRALCVKQGLPHINFTWVKTSMSCNCCQSMFDGLFFNCESNLFN